MNGLYSVRTLAEVLGISERAVRKRAKKEGWACSLRANRKGGGQCKEFAPEGLPEDVRLMVMRLEADDGGQRTDDRGQMTEGGGQRASLPIKADHCRKDLAPEQRKAALYRADLVRFYLQRLKKAGHGGKQLAREQFQEDYNSGAIHAHIYNVVGRIDWKTLERWKVLLRNSKNPLVLSDQRGEKRRGAGLISAEQAQVLIPLICNPNQLPITTVIRRAKEICAERQIENGFSEDTYRRFIKNWIEVNLDSKTFWHDGEHGMDEAVLPYIRRDWSLLEVGDVLVADGHVLNGEAINPETGKPKRMASIWWYDMRSNYPVGWEIMPTENTQAIASAFRRSVLRLGKIPKVLYMDNGKAFRAKFFESCPDFRAAGLTGLFERLGCHLVHAWPHHAQSKPIERFFGTFAELEKLAPSYTGTSIDKKPPHMRRGEHLHRRIHDKLTGGLVPTVEGWHRAIASWVDDYAARPQKRTHLKGRTPAEVFADGRGPGVDAAELNDLMLWEKRTMIGRNGVTLRIDGEPTDFYDRELYGRRHSVLVRYDPVGLALGETDAVLVYSPEGRELLCMARRMDPVHPMAELLGTEADVIKLKEHIELKRSLKKETLATARAFVEAEVLPEVRARSEWSMGKVEDRRQRTEGRGRRTDDGETRLIDAPLTEEEKEQIRADLEEMAQWRDPYAKTFWEEIDELPEMDRYERLMECEVGGMLIPKHAASFMRYFEATERYALLAEYFEARRRQMAAAGRVEASSGQDEG